MKRRTGTWLALVAACMLLMPGCAFIKEHEKAAIGVGAGAVGGAAVGGLAGGSKGAVVGAVAGALAGGAVGAYLDHKDKTAEETQRAHNYSPEQGVRLELTSVAAEPQSVAPGGEVKLKATYAVMAPDPQQEVSVTETRSILLGGAKVAEAAVNVNRTSGTYTSEVPLALPADSVRGTYEVQVSVGTAGQSAMLATSFTVD
ncbi:MAG: YMGG-like glycine zipper-containing protein [Candidatus Brocadiia bacterium]